MHRLRVDKLLVSRSDPLRGDLEVEGSKNAALPLLAAVLLTAEEMQLSNLPMLQDTKTMLAILAGMGVEYSQRGNCLSLEAPKTVEIFPCTRLARAMRASFLLAGPLLARFGEFCIGLPGGCQIGERSIDQHIEGLSALGARIETVDSQIQAVAPAGGLTAARIHLSVPTVTGTENLMMAASLARGESVITNAACDPEVVTLAQCLIRMGAKIRGHGTRTIRIEGVRSLGGTCYSIPPDRIEAGSYLAAVAATGGRVRLTGIRPFVLQSTLRQLMQAGGCIETTDDTVKLDMKGQRPQPFSLTTGYYPAFPTDLQAPFMVLATVAKGVSRIEETVFENRFHQVQAFRQMGADIELQSDNRAAVVTGVDKLVGIQAVASDLRAAFSLIVAALRAEGETEIRGLEHLDRGYWSPELKLAALGAPIERVAG